jgi:hypothetical protein
MGRIYRYPPNIEFYIFLTTNISTEYFKHSAHSPFFSSKCRLFHHATVFVPVLFTCYIEFVLKSKCKTQVPEGLLNTSINKNHCLYLTGTSISQENFSPAIIHNGPICVDF